MKFGEIKRKKFSIEQVVFYLRNKMVRQNIKPIIFRSFTKILFNTFKVRQGYTKQEARKLTGENLKVVWAKFSNSS
jgi:hypothetical protein